MGVLPAWVTNAITDVGGVTVGQTTIVRGENVRTGVTAIVPHSGNLFREKVAGAVFVGNGFGKLAGSTQVNELGEIETPILLTSTLSVPKTADFLMDYMLGLPGNEGVRSDSPIVAQTNARRSNDGLGWQVRGGEVLLPLLLFPLVVPVVLAVVKGTGLALAGDPMDQAPSWLGVLVVFDLVYWSVCPLVFSAVVER